MLTRSEQKMLRTELHRAARPACRLSSQVTGRSFPSDRGIPWAPGLSTNLEGIS